MEYLIIVGLIVWVVRGKIKDFVITRSKDLFSSKKEVVTGDKAEDERKEKIDQIKSVAMYFALIFLIPIGITFAAVLKDWSCVVIAGIGLLGIGAKLICSGISGYLAGEPIDKDPVISDLVGGGVLGIIGIVFTILSLTL